MKSKLRHITVEEITYNYVVKNWELKIFNKDFKNKFVKLDFEKEITIDNYTKNLVFIGHLKVYKNNEETILNINQPSFVKEIIIGLNLKAFDFSTQKQYIFNNALDILVKIGYSLDANT